MKKLIAILLSLVMLLSLAACGGETPVDDTGKETTVQTGGGNESDFTTDTGSGSESDTTEAGGEDGSAVFGEITLEDLMNHPESPESDFDCLDDDNGGVELLEYLGDDEIVVIPETWNGKPITEINAYVFANDSPVRAVKLSSSIRTIDTGAFGLNESLEIVVCGTNLEVIGEGAFQNCTSLKQIVLNDGLTTLEAACLSGCSSLMSIEIPDSVTDIHMMAFYPTGEGFTIIGSAGSAAEEHANSEGITFQAK